MVLNLKKKELKTAVFPDGFLSYISWLAPHWSVLHHFVFFAFYPFSQPKCSAYFCFPTWIAFELKSRDRNVGKGEGGRPPHSAHSAQHHTGTQAHLASPLNCIIIGIIILVITIAIFVIFSLSSLSFFVFFTAIIISNIINVTTIEKVRIPLNCK